MGKKITEGVNPVHRGLVDEQPGHGLEIGLPIKIGLRPAPIARAKPEGDLMNVPERAVLYQGLRLPIPGLKADIFMNYQRCAGRSCFSS